MKLLHVNQYPNYINKRSLTLVDIQRIASALGHPKAFKNGYSCCCPIHDDHQPSLSIWLSDKYPIGLKCYAGCSPKDVYQEIKVRGLLPNNYFKTSEYQHMQTSRDDTDKTKPVDSERKKAYAQELWRKAANSQGSPVEIYLGGRGIQGDIPFSIRYMADAKHVPTGKTYPCMIAAVMHWPNSQVVGVHRTFLSADGKGKASIEQNKMMLGDVSGGAVRLTLTPLGEVLVLGEGIESMLSLMGLYPDYAIWALLSASNFQSLVLPELPLASTIIIAADHDDAGLKAARLAAKKWSSQGRIVKIACSTEKGADFNDALLMGDLV